MSITYSYTDEALKKDSMMMIIKDHEVIVKKCEGFENKYFYTLVKDNVICYKQRTAITLDEIVKEVLALIEMNS